MNDYAPFPPGFTFPLSVPKANKSMLHIEAMMKQFYDAMSIPDMQQPKFGSSLSTSLHKLSLEEIQDRIDTIKRHITNVLGTLNIYGAPPSIDAEVHIGPLREQIEVLIHLRTQKIIEESVMNPWHPVAESLKYRAKSVSFMDPSTGIFVDEIAALPGAKTLAESMGLTFKCDDFIPLTFDEKPKKGPLSAALDTFDGYGTSPIAESFKTYQQMKAMEKASQEYMLKHGKSLLESLFGTFEAAMSGVKPTEMGLCTPEQLYKTQPFNSNALDFLHQHGGSANSLKGVKTRVRKKALT